MNRCPPTCCLINSSGICDVIRDALGRAPGQGLRARAILPRADRVCCARPGLRETGPAECVRQPITSSMALNRTQMLLLGAGLICLLVVLAAVVLLRASADAQLETAGSSQT